MKLYVRLAAVPEDGRTCVEVEVFDGDARPVVDPVYRSQIVRGIGSPPEIGLAHVYAMQVLMAAAAAIAARQYAYPRDALLELVDQELSADGEPAWSGDEHQAVGKRR